MTDNATWPDRAQLLDMTAGFRPACVLGAAAELDLFTRFGDRQWTVATATAALRSDLRATRILLDALAALRLLDKQGDRYTVPEPLRPLLAADGPGTVLPMVRHSTVILRQWTQLAWTVRSGILAPQQATDDAGDAGDVADEVREYTERADAGTPDGFGSLADKFRDASKAAKGLMPAERPCWGPERLVY